MGVVTFKWKNMNRLTGLETGGGGLMYFINRDKGKGRDVGMRYRVGYVMVQGR